MVRVKQLWSIVDVPANVKLVWTRLTASRLAIFYLILTVAHCLIQVTFQLTAHTVNSNARELLDEIIVHAGAQSRNFTLYDPKKKQLRSCWGVPDEGGETCITIWASNAVVIPSAMPTTAGGYFESVPPEETSTAVAFASTTTANALSSITSASSTTRTASSSSTRSATTVRPTAQPDDDGDDDDREDNGRLGNAAARTGAPVAAPTSTEVVLGAAAAIVASPGLRTKRSLTITPIFSGSDDAQNITGISVGGLKNSNHSDTVSLDLQCVNVLRWPLQTLRDTQREDIVFVMFQFWVLGMSIVALLNESIPHTVAALLTHFFATMWSGYQLANTQQFRRNFITLTVNGACKGVNLLPNYWKERGATEISMLVLNVVALVASGLLSWKVVKAFGWATFRRIGADRRINRVYHFVLMMTIFLQLSLFFIVTSVALWIDQLCNGSIGIFSKHMMIYRVVGICVFIVLIPWLTLGWFAVRKESKKMMYGFLGISVFLLGEWATEFLSDTWRLTFINWDFFAIMSIIAAALTLAVTVLGFFCFRNFGLGLSNYLKPDDNFNANDFQRIGVFGDEESSNRGSIISEKVAFPDASVIPSYTLPVNPTPPVQVPIREMAPSAMISGPRPPRSTGSNSGSARSSTASSGAPVLPNLFRPKSTDSLSTTMSDLDPFHLSEKAGQSNPPQPNANGAVDKSRWSKWTSSTDPRSTTSGGAGTVKAPSISRRWVIE